MWIYDITGVRKGSGSVEKVEDIGVYVNIDCLYKHQIMIRAAAAAGSRCRGLYALPKNASQTKYFKQNI